MFLSPPRSPPPLNVTSVLLQKHPFFRHINWEELLARRLDPPFKPCLVPGMLWGAMGLKGEGGGSSEDGSRVPPPPRSSRRRTSASSMPASRARPPWTALMTPSSARVPTRPSWYGGGARGEGVPTPPALRSAIPFLQGFTYVAPSVLESIKEGFSFQPKVRSPRRLNSSPHTPVRYPCQVGGGGTAGKLPPPPSPSPPVRPLQPGEVLPVRALQACRAHGAGAGGRHPARGHGPAAYRLRQEDAGGSGAAAQVGVWGGGESGKRCLGARGGRGCRAATRPGCVCPLKHQSVRLRRAGLGGGGGGA